MNNAQQQTTLTHTNSFGELALMYNCERAATIRVTAASTAWSMDLRTFRRLLATTASGQILRRCEFLRRVPLLQPLNNEQVTKLADALDSVVFKADQYIIRQGEQVTTTTE
jgi:CRP-like cAMP-binding protein